MSPITFTEEELMELKKGPPAHLRYTTLWIKAFAFFNAKHPEYRPMQMTCRPCYWKVCKYIIEKNQLS